MAHKRNFAFIALCVPRACHFFIPLPADSNVRVADRQIQKKKLRYMKLDKINLILLTSAILILSWTPETSQWMIKDCKSFALRYTEADTCNLKEYLKILNNGCQSVDNFFKESFKNKFTVFIHPNRYSLDTTWEKDWNMPNYKSECWMVASGTATKLDMISPKTWDKESCEHKYNDSDKTQKIITHELFHVYHGQLKTSPFSELDSIEWFVEGFATFASGQNDSTRIPEIVSAINNQTIPKSLYEFYSGKLRYVLSGSIVMFIDKEYGRKKLKELLTYSSSKDILNALHISEFDLIAKWTKFIQTNNASR